MLLLNGRRSRNRNKLSWKIDLCGDPNDDNKQKMDDYFVVIICMILLITVLRMARERYVEKLYAEKFHAIEDDDNYRTYVQNYLRVQ